MKSILESATIKFDFKWQGNFLAKVTLNFQNQFEIRFCRLTITKDGHLWFQPPALKEYGWAKCFGIIDKEKYNGFSKRVIGEFYKEFQKQTEEGLVPPSFIEKLNKIKEQEINPDDIPF